MSGEGNGLIVEIFIQRTFLVVLPLVKAFQEHIPGYCSILSTSLALDGFA